MNDIQDISPYVTDTRQSPEVRAAELEKRNIANMARYRAKLADRMRTPPTMEEVERMESGKS